MDPITTMRSRVTRHFLTCIAGITIAFLSMFAMQLSPFAALGVLLIPAVGAYSTFTNLRCPACNKMVAWQVSQNFSAFAPWAKHECRHCGVKIFPGQEAGRGAGGRRFLFVIMGVVFAVLILATAAGFMARHH